MIANAHHALVFYHRSVPAVHEQSQSFEKLTDKSYGLGY